MDTEFDSTEDSLAYSTVCIGLAMVLGFILSVAAIHILLLRITGR